MSEAKRSELTSAAQRSWAAQEERPYEQATRRHAAWGRTRSAGGHHADERQLAMDRGGPGDHRHPGRGAVVYARQQRGRGPDLQPVLLRPHQAGRPGDGQQRHRPRLLHQQRGQQFSVQGPDLNQDAAQTQLYSLAHQGPQARQQHHQLVGGHHPLPALRGGDRAVVRLAVPAGQGQMSGIMSIGRSKAKVYTTERPRTTFSDVAGYDGVKLEIREVVDFLRPPTGSRRSAPRSPRACSWSARPGTGKTLLARAVAGEAGVPFLSVTGSDFMEMFVGVGASRVRDLFQTARKQAPAIIFIDEIDSIGRKRGAGLGGGHDEREQTLNQMLAEMDGFETDRRRRHDGGHQPARHPRPRPAAARPFRPPDRRSAP